MAVAQPAFLTVFSVRSTYLPFDVPYVTVDRALVKVTASYCESVACRLLVKPVSASDISDTNIVKTVTDASTNSPAACYLCVKHTVLWMSLSQACILVLPKRNVWTVLTLVNVTYRLIVLLEMAIVRDIGLSFHRHRDDTNFLILCFIEIDRFLHNNSTL